MTVTSPIVTFAIVVKQAKCVDDLVYKAAIVTPKYQETSPSSGSLTSLASDGSSTVVTFEDFTKAAVTMTY